ncbi:hypothetical protein PTKIN_Ptkin03bG0159400 [Pterospermum kingtungense]
MSEMETSLGENNNELALVTPETQPSKRRIKKSMAWEYFTIENVSPGCRRVCCKHCKESFAYSIGSEVHSFVQNLQPSFDKVSFNTVQGDCVATYLREKQTLMKFIEGIPGRFYLTLDLWTSNQTLGYVFITGHFIDFDWKLQRRVLNVIMEPYPDSDSALSHAVAGCLSNWSLGGKLFSLTFNHPQSGAELENVRHLLYTKYPLILKESHEDKFVQVKNQLHVASEKSLFLDDQTQWNTTYQMLAAASELKEVFNCLDTCDPDYKLASSMADWKLAETLCTFLKPLFDAASTLTTVTNPTAITFLHEAWKICLDLGRSVTNDDPFISNLAKSMQEKIDKYWKDCRLVLAIAIVMDPRFKMKLVEFSFTKIYGEDASTHIKIVDDGIQELFHEYVALPLPSKPTYADEGNSGNNGKSDESHQGNLLDHGIEDFDVYLMETSGQQTKSELDQYLMARDILVIPESAAAPDSIFDTIDKRLDEYRSSLRPETMEALICAKDWLYYGSDVSNTLVKMEF